MSPDDVKKNITERVEPVQYFEFEFFDIFIHEITYSDGTIVTDAKDDAVICKKILPKGLLVETAPGSIHVTLMLYFGLNSFLNPSLNAVMACFVAQ